MKLCMMFKRETKKENNIILYNIDRIQQPIAEHRHIDDESHIKEILRIVSVDGD